ncbi:N-acetylmuramoyl-L-alanine amidase family protein [Butyrivibrio sp. VCB2006]|uniref:N-acetylmuramoyl-L-alanine amidase family protein n=1 Tax=Butyrivibrio sp. VCB2006 TaxID=1280679 RepID=UPI0004274CD0|nr:N-acetylmuramoyl-L-alanine amidase [Butyrivibrio sp. VCB2006]
MKKVLSFLMILFLSVCSALWVGGGSICAEAATKNYIIVIDPGHGGTGDRNLGAQYNGFSEKELTMRVASAMKTELEKYENVTVYLTRTTDTIVSLEDRAKFAKSINADFVFSIHFNASSEHNFYGSEVWTSAFGNYYQKGQTFGLIESDELAALGLYQKGVKTKIGSSGNDYYGIIRQCVTRGIPCDIIEHCYLDHAYDVQYLKDADFINRLGVADATAVAKYFKLKSSVNGNNFTNYTYKSVKKPANKVWHDSTDPDTCQIKVLAFDSGSRNALVEMTTKDSQSPIIYFSYSYDGGVTFSTLQMWDRTKNTQSFNINIPAGVTSSRIVCRAYNNYELFKQSNEVAIETR